MSAELWIAVGGLVLHGMAVIAAGIYQLSKVRGDLMDAMAKHRADMHEQMSEDRRIVTESVQAVRQKINDVELESYKTFVRRDSFHEIMTRVSAEAASFRESIQERLDRQEKKIDRLIERREGGRD